MMPRRVAEAVIVMDESGSIVFANPAACELFGREITDLVSVDISELVPSLDRDGIAKSLSVTTPSRFEGRDATGNELLIEVSFSEFADDGDRRIVATIRDSDAEREQERLFREIETRQLLLFDRNLAGVYRATLDGSIFDCNDACARILGARNREAYLQEGSVTPYMEKSELDEIVDSLLREKAIFGVETGMVRRDGTPVWVLQNLALVESEGPQSIEATMFDITQERIAEEQVEYQAHHDSLTGLANTILFEQRVKEAIEKAEEHDRMAALLLIDLDDFKSINNTMGHGVGNQLLQLVAYRLQKSLRDIDTVARLGGDEFTVILQSLRQPDDAVSVSGKLLDQINKPYLIDGHEIAVTASIGVAICPDDGTTHETLLRNADIAMYRAKDLGRNHVQVCSQATSLEAIERMTLENDLRMALERSELVLHFQPQVDALQSKIHALEALVRWNHPTRGMIMPNDFIPLAERTHLMISIGRWVLGEACRAVARWSEVNPDIRVAVNVSPRQFQDEHFLDHVRESLLSSGLRPGQLELEITEGVAMQNPETALEVLKKLKEMGVRISIDDFGTGYSSLSYLTKFPIDCLKIDQGFVQDIEKGGSESAIIAAVIALAHQLKLHVIAEGVETTAQLDFLVGQKCGSLQGFHFSRPKPVDEIDEMIRKE